jgi:hypothetical protein
VLTALAVAAGSNAAPSPALHFIVRCAPPNSPQAITVTEGSARVPDGRLALLTGLNDRPVLRIWRLGATKPDVYALPLLCRSAGQYALIAG